MPRTKKAIETYEQFRRYIGDQFMPNPEEVNVFRAIYKEEMSQPNGELSWALMLVYLAGKAKGTGAVTLGDISKIAEDLQNCGGNKNALTTGHSEGTEKLSS